MIELSNEQLHFIVSTLDDEDRPKIESHLLRLSLEDRYLRFFAALGDYQIKKYVAGLDLKQGRAFGVFTLPDRRLVGLAHVSRITKQDLRVMAELGVSVDSDMRTKGLGKRLMDRAITYCQTSNVNTLFMSCLRENKVMQKLAREFGLRLVVNADEAMAELDMDPAARASALPREIAYEQISLFDKAYRHNQAIMNTILRV